MLQQEGGVGNRLVRAVSFLYMEAKGRYRDTVKTKKELNNDKQSEEINNLLKINDSRGVWNYINKVAGRKNRTEGVEPKKQQKPHSIISMMKLTSSIEENCSELW